MKVIKVVRKQLMVKRNVMQAKKNGWMTEVFFIISTFLHGKTHVFSQFSFYFLNFLLHCSNEDLDDEIEGEESLGEDDLVIHAEEDEVIEEGPIDCLPESCYKKFPIFAGDDDSPFWQGWSNLRLKTFRLIENKYFETAVIIMILLSSLALVKIQVLFAIERKLSNQIIEFK